MAQSMLLLALGMLVSAPTVVIGALHNAPTGLTLNDKQASWFAGILLIMQPLGSVLSGVIQDSLGRKRCMLMVNLPQLIGWILVYYAKSVEMLFAAAVTMGFSVGFMEAPTLSYVGEISQPHLRGTLASFTSVYISTGNLIMYLMGTFTDWRSAAAISTAVPVIAFVAILQVPESPVWLLMKGRKDEARASLAWLRGWVKQESVSREFRGMEAHCEASKLNSPVSSPTTPPLPYIPVPSNETGGFIMHDYKPTFAEKMKDLVRPEMLRPLRLVVLYFLFLHCAAFNGSKPYLIKVFKRLGLPIEPFVATVIAASSQILGSFVCMGSVRRLGKRGLSLISISACSLITLSLGIYSILHEHRNVNLSWLPLVLFSLLYFFTNFGIGVIPWTLLAEVFPSRGRGVGGGVSAATYYFWFFLVTKTFLDLENLVQLYGVFFFYSFLGFCGFLFLYTFQPETEGRKLEEVEVLFQSKKKRSSPL
ncbi:facilitated trehalose transporter Tret1-like isoform X2 [Rhodnius prolixus]